MHHRTILTLMIIFAGTQCLAAEAVDTSTQLNVTCPAQKLGPLIDNYYHECHSGMVKAEDNSCERFVGTFKELMPEYDCARTTDMSVAETHTVPAIWLLGPGQFADYHTLVHDLVFNKMYSTPVYSKARKEAAALFFSEEFKRVVDAAGEEYADEWEAHEK